MTSSRLVADLTPEQLARKRATGRKAWAKRRAVMSEEELEANRDRNNAYRKKHRAKLLAQRREYYRKNRERLLAEKRVNSGSTTPKPRKWNRGTKRAKEQRLYKNPNYKLAKLLRSRLRLAVGRSSRGGSAVRDLGCTIPELKSYLEAQFAPGMSWDNWAMHGWHIDHIIPLASFDLTDPAQVKIACHFTNLQPLWAAENMSKGARHVVD